MTAVQEMQQAGTAIYRVDDMEFGRRLAVERELEKDLKAGATMNAVWDESGNFLMYPTMLGIKGTHFFLSVQFQSYLLSNPIGMLSLSAVVNTLNNRVVRLLGKDETGRWLNLSLYQGAPAKKGLTTIVCLILLSISLAGSLKIFCLSP